MKKCLFLLSCLFFTGLSFAQKRVVFEDLAFSVPADFTIQSCCTTFGGNNSGLMVSIHPANLKEATSENMSKLCIKTAAEQGYKAEGKVEKFRNHPLNGYYVKAIKEDANAYFLVLNNDDNGKKMVMVIGYDNESEKQATELLESICLSEVEL